MARDIIATDGVGGLYRGLGAGLLRQATYTTGRLGVFQIFSDYLKDYNKGKVPPVCCGLPTPGLCGLQPTCLSGPAPVWIRLRMFGR